MEVHHSDQTPIIINGKEIDRSLLSLGDEVITAQSRLDSSLQQAKPAKQDESNISRPISPPPEGNKQIPMNEALPLQANSKPAFTRAQSMPRALGPRKPPSPIPKPNPPDAEKAPIVNPPKRMEVSEVKIPPPPIPQETAPKAKPIIQPSKPVEAPPIPIQPATPTQSMPSAQNTQPAATPIQPQPAATPTTHPKPERLIISLASIPDYSQYSVTYRAMIRAAFKARFGDLRETYPEYQISQITDEMSLEEVHASYLTYLRNIKVMEKVNSYKIIMYLIWYGFEKLMVWYFKTDISDFADFQWKQIKKYHFSLVQIAEQSLEGGEGAWDPRWTMVWIFGIQTLMFMGAKLLGKILNANIAQNLMGVIDDLLNGGSRTLRTGNQRSDRYQDAQGRYVDLPEAPKNHSSPDIQGAFNSIMGAVFNGGRGGGGPGNAMHAERGGAPPFSE